MCIGYVKSLSVSTCKRVALVGLGPNRSTSTYDSVKTMKTFDWQNIKFLNLPNKKTRSFWTTLKSYAKKQTYNWTRVVLEYFPCNRIREKSLTTFSSRKGGFIMSWNNDHYSMRIFFQNHKPRCIRSQSHRRGCTHVFYRDGQSISWSIVSGDHFNMRLIAGYECIPE